MERRELYTTGSLDRPIVSFEKVGHAADEEHADGLYYVRLIFGGVLME